MLWILIPRGCHRRSSRPIEKKVFHEK